MKCDIKTAPSPRAVFLSLHFANVDYNQSLLVTL